jgi:hypothetical protein
VAADAMEIFWGKCVSSMKKCIFISLEKCFCSFCKFFEVIFDCTCALADQSLRRDRIQALLSLPRLALRAEKIGLEHGKVSRK